MSKKATTSSLSSVLDTLLSPSLSSRDGDSKSGEEAGMIEMPVKTREVVLVVKGRTKEQGIRYYIYLYLWSVYERF